MSARQLPLDLPHEVSFRRDDFLESASNSAALTLIDRWPDWPSHNAAIIGPRGSGKSHLAAIWAERAGARTVPASMVAKSEVPVLLSTGALVVENFRAGEFDETSMFHLLNFAREEEVYLLFTAERPLTEGVAALRDLASRLRTLAVAELAPPGDALIGAVLLKLFADRQVTVDADTIAYLLPRMERSLGRARALVEQIDRAALAAGRPVSRAFVASLFRSTSVQADETID
jgi:chromosomal replication initiation ATPase DnaA